MKLKKNTVKDLAEAYKSMSVVRLREMYAMAVEDVSRSKKNMDLIKSELHNRFSAEALTEIHGRGKEHGECTVEKDGVKIICEVGHKVTWDTEKLKAIAASLPSDTVQRLMKVTITVPERVYQSVTEKDLLDKLTDARTVRIDEPKFSFPASE
jgi:hypothetical protein